MANPTQYGAFIPTTNVWDTEQEHLKDMDTSKPEFKELLVRLFQDLNRMALSVNIRDAGYYDIEKFVNGQLYFPNPRVAVPTTISCNYRQVYRSVVNMPVGTTLPNAGTLS